MSPNDSNFRAEQSAASDDSIQQVHAQLQKQKPEKTDGYSMLPLVLLGLMCCAVFFGSIYLAHFSLRFDPLVYSEHANREIGELLNWLAAERAQLPAETAQAVEDQLRLSMRREIEIELKNSPRPLFAEMSSGQEG
mgnify:CR=1 FL=1